MDILVFSDSHGQTAPMIQTIRNTAPDLVLHLGDYTRDAKFLQKTFPDLPIRMVSGNCDFNSKTPDLEEFLLSDKKIIMTHGHRYQVKQGYDSLCTMGRCAGADILLFGHTHIPYHGRIGNMHILNPGPAHQSCALIRIADGDISCEHLTLK